MDMNRFTVKAREGLASAQTQTVERGHQQVDVEHVLLALLLQERGLTTAIFNKAEIQAGGLRESIEQHLGGLPSVQGPAGVVDSLYVTQRLNSLLSRAEKEAGKLGDQFVSVEHLLLGMTADQGRTGELFTTFGVTRERLEKALQDVRGGQRVTSPDPESTYQALAARIWTPPVKGPVHFFEFS